VIYVWLPAVIATTSNICCPHAVQVYAIADNLGVPKPPILDGSVLLDLAKGKKVISPC
jgi:hypothetical protein